MQRVNVNRGSKHHKPTKGMKIQMTQNRKAAERRERESKVERKQTIPAYLKKKYAALQNWYYKLRFLRGRHTPHQGHQEKARRVRQMQEHKCINPECWVDPS